MKRESFTLIELLVVIVIIGILMGFLLPVLIQAKNRAKVAKAKDSVSQLTAAWQSYLAEYRMFPSDNDDPAQPVDIREITPAAIKILMGQTYASLGGHVFMEFTTNEVKWGFSDPWGTVYQVALDNGCNDTKKYDGKVSVPHQSVELDQSVGAWSKGADKKDSSDTFRLDDVKSWK